jgi:quinol monooxygenase YgiN
MEIFLFAKLAALPGAQDELRQAIADVQAPTRAEPGCLDFHAFQSIRNPDELHIHSRWRDLAAFERHAELPHTLTFVERVERLTGGPPNPSLTRLLP